MKIISSSNSDLGIVEKELAGNEPGIIVLPEGCWDGYQGIPNEHLIATLEYRVSFIGTRSSGRGFDVAYVVKKGHVTPAGVYLRDDITARDLSSFGKLYLALNEPHEISPTDDPISAIIKQCSEIYRNPVRNDCKVDLICVPSAMDHVTSQATKKLFLEVNGRNISENTLFVQAVLNDIAGTDIFQLPHFGKLGNNLDGYKVHKYSKL